MADDLLDNYNPLYDVHLQQYFASPHMQKHLRSIGLLRERSETDAEGENEVYARHNVMMDLMLKNREKQLAKLAALQKKLNAAEKVEICRKIRSGQTPGTQARARPSRSLSRGRKAASRCERRSSTSTDDKDLIRRIESENEDTPRTNSTVYSRLSASVGKYRYLHKLDDQTLSAYMEELRKQLRRLERFRDVSFGPHSVARHPSEPQQSWFFRRRSLPSFSDSGHANSVHEHLRKMRSGLFDKSPSPRNLNESNDNETKDIFAGGKQQHYKLPKIRCSDKASTVNKNYEPILLPVNRSVSKPRSSRSTSKKRAEPVRVQRIKPNLGETKNPRSLEVVGTTVATGERRKPRETVKAITKKSLKTKTVIDEIKPKQVKEEKQHEELPQQSFNTALEDKFVKMALDETKTPKPHENGNLEYKNDADEITAEKMKKVDDYEPVKEVLSEFSPKIAGIEILGTEETIDALAKLEKERETLRARILEEAQLGAAAPSESEEESNLVIQTNANDENPNESAEKEKKTSEEIDTRTLSKLVVNPDNALTKEELQVKRLREEEERLIAQEKQLLDAEKEEIFSAEVEKDSASSPIEENLSSEEVKANNDKVTEQFETEVEHDTQQSKIDIEKENEKVEIKDENGNEESVPEKDDTTFNERAEITTDEVSINEEIAECVEEPQTETVEQEVSTVEEIKTVVKDAEESEVEAGEEMLKREDKDEELEDTVTGGREDLDFIQSQEPEKKDSEASSLKDEGADEVQKIALSPRQESQATPTAENIQFDDNKIANTTIESKEEEFIKLEENLQETAANDHSAAKEDENPTKEDWDDILSQEQENYEKIKEDGQDSPKLITKRSINGYETALTDLLTVDQTDLTDVPKEESLLASEIFEESPELETASYPISSRKSSVSDKTLEEIRRVHRKPLPTDDAELQQTEETTTDKDINQGTTVYETTAVPSSPHENHDEYENLISEQENTNILNETSETKHSQETSKFESEKDEEEEGKDGANVADDFAKAEHKQSENEELISEASNQAENVPGTQESNSVVDYLVEAKGESANLEEVSVLQEKTVREEFKALDEKDYEENTSIDTEGPDEEEVNPEFEVEKSSENKESETEDAGVAQHDLTESKEINEPIATKEQVELDTQDLTETANNEPHVLPDEQKDIVKDDNEIEARPETQHDTIEESEVYQLEYHTKSPSHENAAPIDQNANDNDYQKTDENVRTLEKARANPEKTAAEILHEVRALLSSHSNKTADENKQDKKEDPKNNEEVIESQTTEISSEKEEHESVSSEKNLNDEDSIESGDNSQQSDRKECIQTSAVDDGVDKDTKDSRKTEVQTVVEAPLPEVLTPDVDITAQEVLANNNDDKNGHQNSGSITEEQTIEAVSKDEPINGTGETKI